MAKKTNRSSDTLFTTERYSSKTLREDREYGFYWYSGLWRILRPVVIFLCAVLIVTGIATTAYRMIYDRLFAATEPGNTTPVDFSIASGSSITAISDKLETENMVKSGSIFKYMVQLQGLTNEIHYGTYRLNRNMTVSEVLGVLTSGTEINDRIITIIPGWTCEDIANYLVSAGAIENREQFLQVCRDADFFINNSTTVEDLMLSASESGKLSKRTYPLEGYLAPDTYRVYLNADSQSIIGTLLKQMSEVVVKTFPNASDYEIDEYGNKIETAPDPTKYQTSLTMDETIILASMIQKEAGSNAEMPKVSAVFHNRLNRGMKLQSDPTATYLTDVKRIALTDSDIAVDTEYNTYKVSGLPVGPICSPSKAAIEAALYPDMDYINDGYLYFCSKSPESGELDFSITAEEHLRKVEEYRPLWQAYDREHQNNN